MELTITDRAADQIYQIADEEDVRLEDAMLRIAVVPGGCSGLTYDLGWDTTRQKDDQMAKVKGIPLVMDKKSYLYVDGSELDFTEGLDGEGFHFLNPQATRTCACGESFGL